MPTPEEIKKIAREVARLFVHPDDHTPYREQVYRQVEAVITQLSKDYCIVPKKSVAEWVNDIEFFMPDKRSVTMLRIGAKSLFGKELFNEEKE